MEKIQITIPNYDNKQKTLVDYSKDFLPILLKQFPTEKYYTKTLAIIIGMIAENKKHNKNNPIKITVHSRNNFVYILTEDEGPGLEAPILLCIKENYSTINNSLGKGLYSLLITTISCNGRLYIQSKPLKETYSFQKIDKTFPNQIFIDEIISAIKLPFEENKENGLIIEVTIPIESINRQTAPINLDNYFS